MAGSRPHERVFALTAALLFLATTVAVTGIVIWQARQENKTTQSNQTDQQEATLEGTKLNGFTPIASVEALQSIDLVVGTGEEVKPGATVTAHYTGAVAATGIIFQSSHDGPNQPIPFSLDGVIKGWTMGVPGMKVGGTRRLVIPADLAYGANPPAGSSIPANAALVFDIEVVAVQNP